MIIGKYKNMIDFGGKLKFTGIEKSPYIVALDSNDLNNNYSDYDDITSIENFDTLKDYLLGTAFGFMDEKCIQREVYSLALEKTSNDLNNNWSALTSNEQYIVCKYCLSKVSPSNFVSTVPDASEREYLSFEFDKRNTMARGTWSLDGGYGRLEVLRMYLFSKLGTSNSLELMNDAIKEGIVELYKDGVESLSDDGVPGLRDFFLATSGTPYDGTGTIDGLVLRSYPIIDGSNDTIQDVANNCINIIDGWY